MRLAADQRQKSKRAYDSCFKHESSCFCLLNAGDQRFIRSGRMDRTLAAATRGHVYCSALVPTVFISVVLIMSDRNEAPKKQVSDDIRAFSR